MSAFPALSWSTALTTIALSRGHEPAAPPDRPGVDGVPGGTRPRSYVGLIVAAIVSLAAVAFAYGLSRGGLYADDLFFFGNGARAQSPSPGYLFASHDGHVLPGGLLIFWILARLAPLNFPLVVVLLVSLKAAADLAVYRLLRYIGGRRAGVVILLAVFTLSPLRLPGSLWLAAAIQSLPLELAVAMTVRAYAQWLRTGGLPHVFAATGWYLGALAFDEKGVLVFALVIGLELLCGPGQGMSGRVRSVIRRWRGWVPIASIAVTYSLWYLEYARNQRAAPFDGRQAQAIARNFLGQTFLPSIVGGPWRWRSYGVVEDFTNPPMAFKYLSWAVAVLVVAGTCLRRTRAWEAWLLLSGWFLADVSLVAFGRINASFGLEERYVSDLALGTVVVLAIALYGFPGPQDMTAMPLRQLLWGYEPVAWARDVGWFLAGAAVIGVGVSDYRLVERWHDNPAPSFLAAALRDFPAVPPGAALDDSQVPDPVMSSLFTIYARPSAIFAGIAGVPPPLGVADYLVSLAPDGSVHPADIIGIRNVPGPVPRCGYIVDAGRTVDIPLGLTLPSGPYTLRMSYLTNAVTTMRISAGNAHVAVTTVPAGHNVYVRVNGPFRDVTVQLEDREATLCSDDLTVGIAVATPLPLEG